MTRRAVQGPSVRDLMTAPVHTCPETMTLAAASRRMQELGCNALVVMDRKGRVAGLLSDHEIAMAVGVPGMRADRMPAAAVMRRAVPTCRPDERLHDALDRMGRTRSRRLPVVTADGDVHGLLSIDDVILWGTASGAIACDDLLQVLRAIAVAAVPVG